MELRWQHNAPGFSGWWDSYYATRTDCQGTISDGAGNYDNDIIYHWTIQPPDAEKITLDLSYMDTEQGYDFIYVYDGVNSSAPLIGSYSGSTPVYGIVATSGTMYIEFDSDGIVTDPGFSGTYYCSYCDGSTELTALLRLRMLFLESSLHI